MYRVDREAYNLLDWLGDLGGLKEAIVIVFGSIVGLFHYHTFDDFLVSNLFRSQTKKDRYATSKVYAEDLDNPDIV